jgi:hypothetical protein
MLNKSEAHHKRMMAGMNSQLEKMEACLGKLEATDWRQIQKKKKSVAVHKEAPKEEAAVKLSSTEEAWGPASSRRAPQKTEGMDSGLWWVPEEAGCHPRKDDPLCHSYMA